MSDDACSVNKVEKVDEQPSLYVLYKVNEDDWFLLVPYSPVSFIDSEMCIKLTNKEKEAVKSDDQWLKEFSDKIRFSPGDYLARAVSKDLQKKIDKFGKQIF